MCFVSICTISAHSLTPYVCSAEFARHKSIERLRPMLELADDSISEDEGSLGMAAMVTFVEDSLKGIIEAYEKDQKTPSTLGVFARLDVGLILTREQKFNFWVNEVEFSSYTDMWMSCENAWIDTHMQTFDAMADSLHRFTDRVAGLLHEQGLGGRHA